MSTYTALMSRERQTPGVPAQSVASSIDVNQVYNVEHPLYQEYTKRMQKNLASIIARESAKQRDAQQAVCPFSVPAERREVIAGEFPEFRVVWPQMSVPVHAEWTSGRNLVNQYMTHHLRRFADSYVHYGGSALAYLTMGISNVHLRVVSSSALAVHESFSDDVACTRLIAGAASAATAVGWTVDFDLMRKYAQGDFMRKKPVQQHADQMADALIVDGSLQAMSPLQFCAAMLQHSSSVGMMCVPYHPAMLMHREGSFSTTGVSYEMDEHYVRIKYPEGVAGVTRYASAVWHSWLVNTVRQVRGAENCAFQFELMGVRCNFMLVRVVKIDRPVVIDDTFVHSLQLDDMNELTMVHAWRIKDLTSRPSDPRSWERVSVTVPTRVVEKTHEYAMALPAEGFSRHAIRKRLAVVNDRVVVHGTSVQVTEAMTSAELDVLELALFTHCFVARYEAGKLTSALREVVDKVAGFGSLSFSQRLFCVVSASTSLLYDWTLGIADDVLRGAFDRARKWLGTLRVDRGPVFQPVPRFVQYHTLVRVTVQPMVSAVRKVLTDTLPAEQLVSGMPGCLYMTTLGACDSSQTIGIPLPSDDYEVVGDSAAVFSDVVDTSTGAGLTDDGKKLWSEVRANNEVDEAPDRHYMREDAIAPDVGVVDVPYDHYQYDPGYLETLDDFHEAVVPGVRQVDFTYDPASISFDDQDRSLAAEYLKIPLHFGDPPSAMEVFKSKLHAYNVLKRPMTTQETLSSFQARNLSAPVLALPQHQDSLIMEIWDDFLDIACVPEARTQLANYRTDPVSLEERAFSGWNGKARPENVRKVLKHLLDNPQAWEEYRIDRYESMLKSDVKPPLSDKPLHSRVEPQVIVHHLPEINAIFSSVMRVLVRRFLSLLKPNFMLNLLKDMPQVRDVVQNFHAWGAKVTYLENDFSKYDKSQGAFVHALETFVFEQLGMGAHMLEQWGLGHVDCSVRSVSTGLSLQVRYQRKSGDATTAFGNGMLNMLSVIHAYKGTEIVWAVFMGDDSLVEAKFVVNGEIAVRTLAEKLNLQAKFFVTMSPYFASNFVLINEDTHRVTCVPDPLKRAEKWSMAIPAVDPKWDERYESAVNSLSVYRNKTNLIGLGRALYERYGSTGGVEMQALGDAVASAIRSPEDYRAMWEEKSTRVVF